MTRGPKVMLDRSCRAALGAARRSAVAILAASQLAACSMGIEPNFALRIRAYHGNHEAEYWLGRNLVDNEGSRAEALKFLRRAADGGIAEAALKLQECHRTTTLGVLDLAEAAKWTRWLTEHSGEFQPDLMGHRFNPTGENVHALAVCYDEGAGVPIDRREAFVWYRKAYDMGNRDDGALLADRLATGDGVPRNDREARRIFEKCNAESSGFGFRLAKFYLAGRGGRGNEKRAIKLLREGARHGDLDQAAFLADLLERRHDQASIKEAGHLRKLVAAVPLGEKQRLANQRQRNRLERVKSNEPLAWLQVARELEQDGDLAGARELYTKAANAGVGSARAWLQRRAPSPSPGG